MFVEWMSKSINESVSVNTRGCEWISRDSSPPLRRCSQFMLYWWDISSSISSHEGPRAGSLSLTRPACTVLDIRREQSWKNLAILKRKVVGNKRE